MNAQPRRDGDRWVFPDGKTLPVVSGGDGPTDTAVKDKPWTEKLKRAQYIADNPTGPDGSFSDSERVEVEGLLNEAAAMKAASIQKTKDADKDRNLLNALKAFGAEEGQPVTESDAKALNDEALAGALTGASIWGQLRQAEKSLGERFTESAEFKALMDPWKDRDGIIPDGTEVRSRPHFLGGIAKALGQKAALGPTGFPGMVPIDSQGLAFDPVWGRPLTIRDVITVGTTRSDTVDFARQNTMTNAAAPVPTTEVDAPDATPTLAEGYKPQSVFAFQKVTVTVKTIAHWLAATKRSLSDVGQLRTLIDSFLRFGLEEETEDQIVQGDGTGENFAGILTTSGTQAQAYSNSPIETIRKGITKVSLVGRAVATAVALHPLDDEALDLAKDAQQRYYGLGPFGTGPSTIWGRRRIVSEAVPAGTAIAADWRFAVLWDREQASISVSDSHSDFFIRNLVAVLAELRAAFGLIRPAAFVICDLTP